MSPRSYSRRVTASAFASAGAIAALALASSDALGHSDPRGHSTIEQTITGGDPTIGYQMLSLGRGEKRQVRDDLGKPKPGRKQRRKSLIYFGQITDMQLPDEESPARAEGFDTDPFGRLETSGFRPQEALVIQMTELTIRQLNNFVRSPVRQGDGKRARMKNAVMTGDLADNMQRNETQWVAELLEGSDRYPGGNPLSPDPSVKDPLDPNSGTNNLAGTACNQSTPLDDPRNYTGVQDYDDYIDDNPIYYDPDDPRGIYEERGFPTYPGLLDRAQLPFKAEGLKVPSYVLFGNHDALFQGTTSAQAVVTVPGAGHPPWDRVAVNCLKHVYPQGSPEDQTGFLTLEQLEQMLQTHPERVMQVPPDSNRQFVDKRQFKDLFRLGAQKDAHGFAYIDRDERNASNDQASYYAFTPKRGIRYIALDTVSESGLLVSPLFPDMVDEVDEPDDLATGASGNIDHPQWIWLQQELEKAEKRNQLVIVFAHHNVKSLINFASDETAPCSGIQDEHGHDAVNPSCDRDPRQSTPLHSGQDLVELYHEHPNVIASVAGHTHENEINAFPDGAGGGFWEITTPAIADWPPQHRLIEIMDNRDGTLSIFGTVLDHEGPVKSPPTGTRGGRLSLEGLGSIGRTIEYNDPQVGPEPEKVGEPTDRNVELLIRDPRQDRDQPPPSDGDRDGDRDGGDDGDRRDSREPERHDDPRSRPRLVGRGQLPTAEPPAGEPARGADGDLPFTGLSLALLVAAGLALLAAGMMGRRRGR